MTREPGKDGALLVLNGGSSSLKFALYRWSDLVPLRSGLVQQHGDQREVTVIDGAKAQPRTSAHSASGFDAGEALGEIEAELADYAGELVAIGHRVVHGGRRYDGAAKIDSEVLAELQGLVPLAPLHQPHNLALIARCAENFPQVTQYAAFDTAFHRTLPEINRLFALPEAIRAQGIERYGFHGLSYRSVLRQLQSGGNLPGRIVIAHLGNGASLCALRDGVSTDTSMGFTALDGLPMATRCGSLDPGVVLHLMNEPGLDHAQLTDLLYHRSGLLGLSGISGDTRVLLESDSREAQLAIDYFCTHIARGVAQMATTLGGIDQLVFTGGIGEHQWPIRARVCARLAWMGVDLDAPANETHRSSVHAPGSRVAVRIVRSDEQREIALQGRELLTASHSGDP